MRGGGSDVGGGAQAQVGSYGAEDPRADALDLDQVVQGAEGPVLVTVGHDALGQPHAHALDLDQLEHVHLVDVHQRLGVGAPTPAPPAPALAHALPVHSAPVQGAVARARPVAGTRADVAADAAQPLGSHPGHQRQVFDFPKAADLPAVF